MSNALVVVLKDTNVVLAGLTRTSGGPVSSVADIVGQALPKIKIAGKEITGISSADLGVKPVEASEADVSRCTGAFLDGEGKTAHLAFGAQAGVNATWTPSTKTLTLVSTAGPIAGAIAAVSASGVVETRSPSPAASVSFVFDFKVADPPILVFVRGFNPVQVK